jgi:RND family efflux transporter MFP subunit
MKLRLLGLVLLVLGAAASGCGHSGASQPARPAVPPARVENSGVKEGDLATIVLTEEAERRLGIETAAVVSGPIPRYRILAGEVVLPPGAGQAVSSPVAGVVEIQAPGEAGTLVRRGQALLRIIPMVSAQRDLKVAVEAELAASESRLEAAKSAAARAEKMLHDEVGSVRALEQARLDLKVAESSHDAARARLDQVTRAPLDADVSLAIVAPLQGLVRQWFVANGQMVSAGAPLIEITNYAEVWIRVPVYTGEARELNTRASVRVEHLGVAPGPIRTAAPVAAPPTADSQAATIDLYYRLVNPDLAYRPGQKLNVTLPLQPGKESELQVPRAAILYDYLGGAWLYEKSSPRTFTRRRVEIVRTVGETTVLARGPKAGTQVVTAGAAELFGTEFGAGK